MRRFRPFQAGVIPSARTDFVEKASSEDEAFWRRVRDSNPRYISVHSISSRITGRLFLNTSRSLVDVSSEVSCALIFQGIRNLHFSKPENP